MFREYLKRLIICVSGLACFAFGTFLGVKAGSAGTNAWNTLALGISSTVGSSFGTATLCVSAVIIGIDLLGRGKLGVGSILNALLIPVFSDFFLAVFTFIPDATTAVGGAAYTLLGQTIISFATIRYMKAGLGCGPRDTLMVIIGRKMPKAPIGTVKFVLEAGALLVGILMGAPFGLGTVLVMVLQASIFQLACKLTRYEPRDVTHEDLIDTWRRIFSKNR